ncbi:S41 family peptidase [Patescibacteria group bacterium]|nr:S41 family peptidase [Patescibacteria group bacterium]MBU1956179.1 S41 family peptidase [Patescibacteria group bacterium]MBU2009883.1 S41 family peptidase [Patescibacteria group bacterium]
MIFNKKNLFVLVVSLFFLIISFGTGFFVGKDDMTTLSASAKDALALFLPDTLDSTPPENVDLSLFWSAWNSVNEKYVTSKMPSDEEKIWGAIKGMVGSLDDPYSVFFPPVEAKMFKEDVSGNFEGVGMEIGMRDKLLTVIAPLKGTPAEAAGMQSGDKIIQIDEISTFDLSLTEAVSLIRGEKGTIVKLTVIRDGATEPLEKNITRDVIEMPIIDIVLRDDGIFVIELYSFSETSPRLFQQAIEEFKVSGSNKLILDLRNNPGGYMQAAVDIASYFLPEGKIVVRESYGLNRKEDEHRTLGYHMLDNTEFEMMILINQGSASASEILAGALSEYNIATLVGVKSFGKGSVQELINLDEESSLKLTIARWLTPNGISISEEGLDPDVLVPMTIEEIIADNDIQKEKAVDILLGKISLQEAMQATATSTLFSATSSPSVVE